MKMLFLVILRSVWKMGFSVALVNIINFQSVEHNTIRLSDEELEISVEWKMAIIL